MVLLVLRLVSLHGLDMGKVVPVDITPSAVFDLVSSTVLEMYLILPAIEGRGRFPSSCRVGGGRVSAGRGGTHLCWVTAVHFSGVLHH